MVFARQYFLTNELVLNALKYLDYENYTNAQFDKARAQQADGFVDNNTYHADCEYLSNIVEFIKINIADNTTVNSWIEQRQYVC